MPLGLWLDEHEIIDQQLRYLAGKAPPPDLGDLSACERSMARSVIEIVTALADSLPASPPLEEDPVAIRLGIVRPR